MTNFKNAHPLLTPFLSLSKKISLISPKLLKSSRRPYSSTDFEIIPINNLVSASRFTSTSFFFFA